MAELLHMASEGIFEGLRFHLLAIDSHRVGVVDIAKVQRLCAIDGLPDAFLRDLVPNLLVEHLPGRQLHLFPAVGEDLFHLCR